MAKFEHRIEFVGDDMNYAEIANAGAMRNTLLDVLDELCDTASWETYQVQETTRASDGKKGLLIFLKRPL